MRDHVFSGIEHVVSKIKKHSAVIGWTAAALCVGFGGITVANKLSTPLSLMLYVDGNEVCCIENRDTAEDAIALLDEKFNFAGGFGKLLNIECRLVDRECRISSVEECAEGIYNAGTSNYSRAYGIYADGKKLGCCATYGEASGLVNDFRSFLSGQISAVEKTAANKINITTDFSIKSCFCSNSDITSADKIFSRLTGDTVQPSAADTENAGESPLSSCETASVNDISTEAALFSFDINNVTAYISYNTVKTEKFSEIIPFDIDYLETDELLCGETVVLSEGKNGIAENIYEVSYDGDTEIGRTLISSEIVCPAENSLVRIGTRAYPDTNPTGSFCWPVRKRLITTHFGEAYETQSGTSFHNGVDIAGMNIGADVIAADGGEVIYADYNGNYGITVKILHEDGVITSYSHLSSALVRFGERVYKGQKIAEVGMTGVSTGPHLHFNVEIEGIAVNPLDYLPAK